MTENQHFVVPDFEQAKSVLSALYKRKCDFAFDLEATTLKERHGKILCIGFSWQEHTGISIPINVRDIGLWVSSLRPRWLSTEWEELLGLIKQVLTQPGVTKAAHNAGFEYAWVKEHWGITPVDMFCTYLYRFIRAPDTSQGYERKLSLGYIIAEKYPDLIGLKDIWKGIKADEYGNKDLSLYYSTERLNGYCAGDCDATYRELKADRIDIMGKPFAALFSRRLMPSTQFVSQMSRNGFLVDIDYLNEERLRLTVEREGILSEIQDVAGNQRFNPQSREHLEWLFFRYLKLPKLEVVGKQTKGDISFDDLVLRTYQEQHDTPVAGKISEYRHLSKLISTYFDGVEREMDPKTGRVHPDFKLWGTVTGRLSCREPNLQNLPKKDARSSRIVKRMFIAAPGCKLIGADYSQIELRLIAYYSQDPVLLDAYIRGLDLHKLTASILFGVPLEEVTKFQRDIIGKTANFALCYGAAAGVLVFGSKSLGNKIMGPEYAQRIGVPYDQIMRVKIDRKILLGRANEIRDRYFAGYKGIMPWTRGVIKQARIDGYVTTDYGRIRYLPGISDPEDSVREHWERCAVNMRPQGTASDYLMFHFMDMMNNFKRRGWKARQQLMVHDQLVMEVDEDYVDRIVRVVPELGVRQDEANIGIEMKLEPEVGDNLGEVS